MVRDDGNVEGYFDKTGKLSRLQNMLQSVYQRFISVKGGSAFIHAAKRSCSFAETVWVK